MNTLTTLPSDAFVAAAFAELLTDVETLLAGARAQQPQDRDEVKFWQAQFNALNKAQAYWLQGVRPTIAGDAYLLASASRPGALVHRLVKQGGIVVCSCEASRNGRLCFHHILINVLERAAELESTATKEAQIAGSGNDPSPNPIPHAAEAAAWLSGQITVQQRVAATDTILEAMRTTQARVATTTTDSGRRLGLRLVTARRRSAYFTSAFYLNAA